MLLRDNKILRTTKEYLLITVGILLYTLAWAIFLVPNNIVGGGVTGAAAILQYATSGAIKIGYTYFVVNTILVLIALRILGPSFGAKTVYAIIVGSIGLNVFQDIIPADFIAEISLANGKLMSTIMGGIMAGLGIGLSISQGGSSGGTDIIALIVNKYRDVSPGKMILWIDVVIIASSILVPSYTKDGNLMPFVDKFTTVIYGLILVFINSTVLDFYLSGSKQSVQVFIMSQKYKEIADAITKELHRGVTVLHGKGWYSQEDSEVVMVLTRKTDLNILLRYVKSIDNNAFVSVGSVTGVYGKGFETIKVKK